MVGTDVQSWTWGGHVLDVFLDVSAWGPPSRRYFFRRAGPSKKAALVGPMPSAAVWGVSWMSRRGAPLPGATFFAGLARQKKQLWSAPRLVRLFGAAWLLLGDGFFGGL